jgi:hypothetical protein
MSTFYSWKGLTITAAVLLGLGGLQARAASDRFTFMESQKDSLSCSNKTDNSCTVYTVGKFTAKILFFAGAPPDILVDDSVTVTINNWSFTDVISNGKDTTDTATFELTDLNCSKDPCKTNEHGTVEFKRSPAGITVTVKTKTGATADDTYEVSPVANEHATDNSAFTDEFTVGINVNSSQYTDAFTGQVAGRAATKPTKKDGGTFDLNTVSCKSTGISP